MNKKLFDLREYNNLYQKDIAKILGISQQTYSQWETGTKIIPLKHLNSLCNYYKVSMDYIIGLTKNKDESKQIKTLDKKSIGKNLKKIRDDHHLTMRELAKILNTTSSTISGYETGKTLIITAFAYQICKEFDISMDWLCNKK